MSDKDILSPLNSARVPKKREGRKGSSASISARDDFSRADSFSIDDGMDVAHLKSYRKPTPRLIGTLMIWLKNVNRLRAVSTSKAFYKWKYSCATTRATTPATFLPMEEMEIKAAAVEQKNNYLLLFAENEKLREQLVDIRRAHSQADKQLRSTTLRLLITSFLRKRWLIKVRSYYDTWLSNTRMMKLVAAIHQRSVELAVGLQQVESERTYVRQTETANVQLRMLLSMAIYFFKWKGKIARSVLTGERKKYEEQRRVIFQELRKMKEIVAFANDQEETLLKGALKRGDEAGAHLTVVKDRIAQIVTASRQYKALQVPESTSGTPDRVQRHDATRERERERDRSGTRQDRDKDREKDKEREDAKSVEGGIKRTSDKARSRRTVPGSTLHGDSYN